MKWLSKYKNEIYKIMIGIILTGCCTGIWQIVRIISAYPKNQEINRIEHAEFTKRLDALEEGNRSLNRRVTNNQTELFKILIDKNK